MNCAENVLRIKRDDGNVETSKSNLMKNPPPWGYSSGSLKARENPSGLSPGYMWHTGDCQKQFGEKMNHESNVEAQRNPCVYWEDMEITACNKIPQSCW